MKKIIPFFLFAVIIASCKKETLAPLVTTNDMADSAAVVIADGIFMPGPYGTTMGTASIIKAGNQYKALLEGFTVSNGPDLHVMLSAEPMPVNFIDLGSIKSTNGNQLYDIPNATPNLNLYRYVSIHCVEYNHLFGYAELN